MHDLIDEIRKNRAQPFIERYGIMGKWADLGYAELYAGDFDSALEHFRKGAEENDAESCWGIVELCESCVPKEPAAKAKSEAARMLARAAELGHEKAAFRFAYVNGKKPQRENQNKLGKVSLVYRRRPFLPVLFFGLTVIFREKLFYSGSRVYFFSARALCAIFSEIFVIIY